MSALPVFKLGMLAVRQLSKYVANFIKERAKKNATFRNYFCIAPAQLYNRVEIRTKMWTMKMGKPTNIKPLSEAAAIDLGASMLGEFVLFLICGAAVVSEVSRQVRSERRKREEKIQAAIKLTNNILSMEEAIEQQEEYIKEINKALRALGKKIEVPPGEKFHSKLLRPIIATKSIETQITIPTRDKGLQVDLS
ncbi:putative OPA3-like protein CG13603 isoform X1 [Anastrepha obliqua]|uniref:putative OPA3-like protein CG13603 isoform X1 n=1 Tax=Anastrepha obliqua TaxID=95512 RepID=UPI002409981E|nr:putative OPA3-like protein CG13603 isoform X1 [Anastrepha obliqua]